ncbi:hypothetical protein CLOM_g377 [Closterium sp. NIES-68]|nr:hypothetical protein CLOM_g377 [Closterium sp. NIES-68]
MAGVRLKLVGSSRHREDERRIELLGCLAVSLGIERRVDFAVNIPFRDLQQLLGSATCGLHTMWDEHFGISVVGVHGSRGYPHSPRFSRPQAGHCCARLPCPGGRFSGKMGQAEEGGEEKRGGSGRGEVEGLEGEDSGGKHEGGNQVSEQSEPLISKGEIEEIRLLAL